MVNAAFNQSVDLRLYSRMQRAEFSRERMIRQSGNRFADKIMRQINKFARDRTQNRCPLLLLARV
jgi:predicted secreted protein